MGVIDIVTGLRRSARETRDRIRRKRIVGRMARECFADVPVDLGAMNVFRAERFPESGPLPWLDRDDAFAEVDRRVAAGSLTAEQASVCRKWESDGYVVLEKAIEPAMLDGAWKAYLDAIAAARLVLDAEPKSADDPHPGRYLNPHNMVPELRQLMDHPAIGSWVECFLGRPPVPYQTITSHKGSEQGLHSDAIHMTTYPRGYLAAAWIAFEDLHPDCGPLVFYPGSHRAPFLSSRQVGIELEDFQRRGYALFQERYEPAVLRLVAQRKLEPRTFAARKGDVLLWHSNLVHGGSVRRDVRQSRKSMVVHYFGRGAICYHDLSGALAIAGRYTYA